MYVFLVPLSNVEYMYKINQLGYNLILRVNGNSLVEMTGNFIERVPQAILKKNVE